MLKQRLQYMETLLSHYIGDVDMDISTLQSLVEAVDCNHTPPDLASEDSHDSDDIGPNPEITVQPLENNMTRTISHLKGVV